MTCFRVVSHFITPVSHIQTEEGVGTANKCDIGRDSLSDWCDNGIILISTGLVALSIAVFISTASSVQPQFQLDATRQVLHFLFLRKTKQEKPKTPKQTNTPNLSSTTYILFCPMQKLRDGGIKKTTPWKIQLSILSNSLSVLCLCLRCSPKEVSFSVVFFRSCMLITFPSRCLCYMVLKRFPPTPPAPPCSTSLTSRHSGELSRVARQSGKRFC